MTKILFAILILTTSLLGQNTAIYPTRAITNNDIGLAIDNFYTTLTSAINASVTTLPVNTTTGSITPIILGLARGTSSFESVLCTSKTSTTFTSCTRGFNNSTAKTHNKSSSVTNDVSSFYINQLVAEVLAIETDLIGGILTNQNKYIALHAATPVSTAVPVYVGSSATSGLTPSVCTISASTITCPLSGATSIEFGTATAFASLGAATANKIVRCSDCTVATPCSGSGSGAWAFSNGSTWNCPHN